MRDEFGSLTLKEAIAVQIFYSSPDDENLTGKTLTGRTWVETTGVVVAITFREMGSPKNEVLEKLIAAREYKKILQQFDKPGKRFYMVVIYKNDKGELKETNLTNAIELALSPDELPKEIMDFLLQNKEYSFLAE